MAGKIYRLKHPSPEFTGYFGIDFFHGVGSTSNKLDADRLCAVLGCTLIVEGEKNGAGIGGPVPVPDIPVPEDPVAEPDPKAKVRPGRKPKAK